MTDHFIHWCTTWLREIIIIQRRRIAIPCNTSLIEKIHSALAHFVENKIINNSLPVRIFWNAVTPKNKILQAFLLHCSILLCFASFKQKDSKAIFILLPFIFFMFNYERWNFQVQNKAWKYLIEWKNSHFQWLFLSTRSKIFHSFEKATRPNKT